MRRNLANNAVWYNNTTDVYSYTVNQREVDVRTTTVLRLQSAGVWRSSRVRDLGAWLQANIREVVQHVVLSVDFSTILQDVVRVHSNEPARVDGQIADLLRGRASSIGYAVDQVISFPDQEARELLDGFSLDFSQEFATAWSEREVKLQVHVSGRFEDFERQEVSELLSRGHDVKNWLERKVVFSLAQQLRDLTPNDIFFHWNKTVGDVRTQLSDVVEARMHGYGVVDIRVQLTPETPSYVENLRSLRGGGPYNFSIDIGYRHHHDRHVYAAAFTVEGLSELGADNWFNRVKALSHETIGKNLGVHLADCLGKRSEGIIVTEDAHGGDLGDLREELEEQTKQYCGSIFGLAVRLVNLRRKSDSGSPESLINRLRKKMIGHIENNNLEGAREVGAIISQLSARSAETRIPTLSGTMSGTMTGVLRAAPVEILVDAPEGQYQSTEAGCLLDLAMTLRLRPMTAEGVDEARVIEVAQHAVRKALGRVAPEEFWLEFDRAEEGQASLKMRLEQRVKDEVEGLVFGVEEVSVKAHSPSPTWREKLLEFVQNESLSLDGVEIDGGRALARMTASFSIDGIASGHWSRFQQFDGGTREVCEAATRWVESNVFHLRRQDCDGDIAPKLESEFRRFVAQTVGLRVTLSTVSLDSTYRVRERLITRLRTAELTIEKLAGASDAKQKQVLGEAEAERDEVIAQLDALDRLRHPSKDAENG